MSISVLNIIEKDVLITLYVTLLVEFILQLTILKLFSHHSILFNSIES